MLASTCASDEHASPADAPSGMARIPGGTLRMGSDRHYPEEAPVHRVTVDTFLIDRAPVTNRAFRKFINATGYVTVAEKKPDPADYPGALPDMLKAGSLESLIDSFVEQLSQVFMLRVFHVGTIC